MLLFETGSYIAKDGLELILFLPTPPEPWDWNCAPLLPLVIANFNSFFRVHSEGRRQVLMLPRQALCQLSHLLSPSFSISPCGNCPILSCKGKPACAEEQQLIHDFILQKLGRHQELCSNSGHRLLTVPVSCEVVNLYNPQFFHSKNGVGNPMGKPITCNLLCKQAYMSHI